MGETPGEPRKKTEHGTFQAGREAKLGREGGLHSTDAQEAKEGGFPGRKIVNQVRKEEKATCSCVTMQGDFKNNPTAQRHSCSLVAIARISREEIIGFARTWAAKMLSDVSASMTEVMDVQI